VLFSIQIGQIYMTGTIFRPYPNSNPINTNPNTNRNPNPDPKLIPNPDTFNT